MKLKVSLPELRRLAVLMTESVAAGHATDTPFRDYVVGVLRADTNRREAHQDRKTVHKRLASAMAIATYQKLRRVKGDKS